MGAERRRRIDGLVEAAAARAGAERAAFLDAACGDDRVLRREVESLVAGASDAGRLLPSAAWRQPALAPGARLGPHEILDLLGAGGMGEVYRAHDTKLDRDVALKILPELFARDPERLRRFEREAKVLASLNHPHIAHIYGLEEADGVKALVLELIDGPTLADRIAQGPIPLDEALPMAAQIAEALDAAHEHGIIHRDLKPANIKVREDGTVKVLDFGLAKALDAPASDADLSNSPTLTSPATVAGVILGTAAYMSPEQLKGRLVDKRADIWAFGVVLFEMLTGTRPFDGGDVTDVLAAVVRAEPDWSALPATTPHTIERLLRWCLVKSRADRLRDIGDARLLLDAGGPADSAASTDAAPDTRRVLPAWPLSVVAALTGVGLAAVVAWTLWPSPASSPVTAFAHQLPDGLAFRRTGRPVLALSRDGRQFVYNTTDGLYRRTISEPRVRLIAGTEGDLANPFFSPDGTEVGYFDFADQQLKRISVNGGTPVVICSATNPYGVSWEADGTILFSQHPEGILRVPATGGTPKVVIPAEGKRLYGPQLLPDEDKVLFVEAEGLAWDEGQIVVASLRTGARTPLGLTGRDVRYLPTGHLVYAVEGSLFAVAFDVGQLAPLGGAASILQGVATAGRNTGAAFFAVSDTGTLTYVPGGDHSGERRLVWVDRSGNEAPLSADVQAYRYPRLSPEGARVAVSLHSDRADILVLDLLRGVAQNLTSSDSYDAGVLWTTTGDRLVFSSNRDGPQRLYAIAAEGGGDVETLTEGKEGRAQYPECLTPDGSWLIYEEEQSEGGGSDLWMMSLEGDREAEDLLVTEFDEEDAELSPNGRWLAYGSNRSGQFEVYVSPFPDVRSRRDPVSRGGGTTPVWAPNGRELFYVGGSAQARRRMMSVSVDADPVLRLGSPVELFDVTDYYLSAGRTFDIHPDGQRFLMIKPEAASAEVLPVIEVVLNWFEELKAQVPTGR